MGPAWWTLTFYNAWFMTVNDDPMVWFYYIYELHHPAADGAALGS